MKTLCSNLKVKRVLSLGKGKKKKKKQTHTLHRNATCTLLLVFLKKFNGYRSRLLKKKKELL